MLCRHELMRYGDRYGARAMSWPMAALKPGTTLSMRIFRKFESGAQVSSYLDYLTKVLSVPHLHYIMRYKSIRCAAHSLAPSELMRGVSESGLAAASIRSSHSDSKPEAEAIQFNSIQQRRTPR